ncbi:hypothetical protein EBE87_28260 [Pseudoroseomonas wenyumeiae]|uniref:Uncharacterized protein n=1 Tax=Teichococcus wenyumeiae TaxID=2478470 RepID=A0A3A9J5N6_9PROT|nr:hypothetical protein D6Z83_27385 [Pseudoroseomonas wenyumeiae]RMI13714.1 hypothetical protein EBE87_28260 [Pseudoroseomonas wenyumeiae]
MRDLGQEAGQTETDVDLQRHGPVVQAARHIQSRPLEGNDVTLAEDALRLCLPRITLDRSSASAEKREYPQQRRGEGGSDHS